MKSSAISYVDEIQHMMYSAGDCRRPLVESAAIVEDIVRRQMIWFIQCAQEACEARGGPSQQQQQQPYLDAEDIMFVLRNRPTLLARTVQKLKAKDFSAQTAKTDPDVVADGTVAAKDEDGIGDDEDNDPNKDAAAVVAIGIFEEKGRRVKFCRKVLEKIDPGGFLVARILDNPSGAPSDPGKSERLKRIADYVSAMDADEYVRYSEARQVSFTKSFSVASYGRTGVGGLASPKKLREWLFGSDPFFASNAFKPSPMFMEILNILAYEILATIMDCAFVVKRESIDAGFGAATKAARTAAASKNRSSGGSSVDNVLPRISPLIATSSSQQMALLLSQKLRAKPQNRDVRFGMDRLVDEAVQPWELREAVRRLRFTHGNSASSILEEDEMPSMFRVIF